MYVHNVDLTCYALHGLKTALLFTDRPAQVNVWNIEPFSVILDKCLNYSEADLFSVLIVGILIFKKYFYLQ